jgi:hypothetical protein
MGILPEKVSSWQEQFARDYMRRVLPLEDPGIAIFYKESRNYYCRYGRAWYN